MKVAREMLTVLVDSDTRKVFIILAGLRVTLTEDETASLTEMLFNGLEQLTPKDAAYPGANEVITLGSLSSAAAREEPTSIGRDHPQICPAPATAGQNEAGHEQMRTRIKARMQDRGLSIWQERRK
jgi:hypothetical protein